MHRMVVTPAHASPHSDGLVKRLGVVAQVTAATRAIARPTNASGPRRSGIEPPHADGGLMDEQQRHQGRRDETGQAEHEHPSMVHTRVTDSIISLDTRG